MEFLLFLNRQNTASDDSLQCFGRTIWNDLGIDFPIPLEKAKHDGFG